MEGKTKMVGDIEIKHIDGRSEFITVELERINENALVNTKVLRLFTFGSMFVLVALLTVGLCYCLSTFAAFCNGNL